MSYVLTLDFETKDPSISQGRGAGWPFKDFGIIGAAYQIDSEAPVFTVDMEEVEAVVRGSKALVMHNAQYDIGVLHRLGIDYSRKTIVDTMILAKLYDNTMQSYSLDSLGSWLLGVGKDYGALEEAAKEHGIKKYMSHLDILFVSHPELVAQYAKQDVNLTYRLSQWFKEELYEEALDLIPMYSDLIKALVLWRSRGIKIDLEQAERSDAALQALHDQYLEEFYTYCPGVNIESTKQLAEAFKSLGLVPGVSDKGGDSVDSKWRSTQSHPAVVALESAKKYNKLRREFVEGIVNRTEEGRLYPEMNILGASETGRFSSSNPNIQQIPKRDKLATELVRSLIVADEGKTLYSLDFSSQEPRLQVHYAYLADCRGASEVRSAYLKNPNLDLHQQVANMAGIDRKQAKTINLGISYGMGPPKLADALKIDKGEARDLLSRYSRMAPYLEGLNRAVKKSGTRKGYITTLLGRRLKMDYDAPYKALNKLIQGGAADQTTLAMVQAYREGLEVMFAVHDELVLQASNPADAERLKVIMETGTDLTVPSVTDIMGGPTWGTLTSHSS